jgi:hypothetical protein
VNGNVNDGEMASNSKEDSFHKQGRLQNFYIRQLNFLSIIPLAINLLTELLMKMLYW